MAETGQYRCHVRVCVAAGTFFFFRPGRQGVVCVCCACTNTTESQALPVHAVHV